MTTLDQLNPDEYNTYYQRYIDQVAEGTALIQGYELGLETVVQFFQSIPIEKHEFRYKINKWTIKEVFQHIIDTERVFIYRCFRIARGDQDNLIGFDQNDYIIPSNANEKSMKDIILEYKVLREYSISLLKSLRVEDLLNIGKASDNKLSSQAAAFIVLGHEKWHMKIISEKYL